MRRPPPPPPRAGRCCNAAARSPGPNSCLQTETPLRSTASTPLLFVPLQETAAWEGRGAFLYHVDAGGDIAAQALTLIHLAHIWARAGFSFSLVRVPAGRSALANKKWA